MGPRSIDRGKHDRTSSSTVDANASMGPRSIDRGKKRDLHGGDAARHASMGPRSIDRGKKRSAPLVRWRPTCFNGAAIDRSRKGSQPRLWQYRGSRFNGAADRSIAERY